MKQTSKIVLYLVVSLLAGIAITLIVDKIENRTVELRIRKSAETSIRDAIASFEESAKRHTRADEKTFIRKFIGTVMKDKVLLYEPGSGVLPDRRFFLFTLRTADYTFDFYLREGYLKSELAILDVPDYLAGIGATIVFFFFISFYMGSRKKVAAMQQQFEVKKAEWNDALQQHEALALLGRMSAALAHELKTPVATISNLVQTLPARRSDEQFVKRFMELTREELNRTQQLIDNMLAYGKEIDIRSGEWIPATALLGKESANGILVDVPRQFELFGDKFYLDLLFKNLVRNSREAGAHTISVRVEGPQSGGNVIEILCDDDGTGFSLSADIEKLTDPFVTSRSRGGGLGLYLARKIVIAHGGTLALARMDRGARVIIALPVSRIKVTA